ncbi:MAG: NAD-dependent epimerase/dehydratase family protein [Thermodesulfobacteriota bacterium]
MIPDSILRWLRRRNVLVTGGTGMVGRQITRLACDAGACVRTASLDDLQVDPRAEHLLGDLTDPAFCRDATRDMEIVFHVAGIKGSVEVTTRRPASFFVPLLLMNANLLEASRRSGVRRLVFTSSIGAYPSREVFREADAWDGPPMDLFPGWAKRMGELQIEAYQREFGIDTFAVVRLANVYGPGDSFDPASAMVIPSLMSRVRRGEDPLVVWGDGSAVRDFVHSRDVAEGVVLALYHGSGPAPVNLGSGVGCSVAELVETLSRVVPFRYRFDATRPAGFPVRVMAIERARDTLGWQPRTSLEDGLRETWDWFVAHEREFEHKQNYFAARSQGNAGGDRCCSFDEPRRAVP